MQVYNFDEIIDRKGSNCLKWDVLEKRFGRSDLLPLWVADMDFKTPDFIMNAIRKRCEHEILGYSFPDAGYYKSIINWLSERHELQIDKSMLGFIPGVVPGLAYCVNCFSDEGNRVIIQPPIYPPFATIPKQNNRIVLTNPLRLENGRYYIDFEQLSGLMANNKCSLFLLCNPHNPGGRSWTKEELTELAEICAKHEVLVVSDEIHGDLVLPGHRHVSFSSVSEAAKMNSITLMAPSKTFNIAGLASSFYFAHNSLIKRKMEAFLHKNELATGSIFAYIATQAAFEYGGDWLEQLIIYLKKNADFVNAYLKKHIPQIKAVIPEASFLIWLDCRELQLSQPELVSLFINKAKLALNDGTSFGEEGTGFMRLNIGCPQSILEQALEQLKNAVKS